MTTTATAPKKVSAIPAGMHTVTPHLVCAGAAEAIEFYKKAFGAQGGCALTAPNGKIMHAAITIGDSHIFLFDEMPEHGALGPKARGGSSVAIHLYVEDADAVWEKAVKAGAKVIMPIHDAFWGDRYGKLEDPYGHHWSVATHQKDLTPEEMKKGMESACCGSDSDCGDKK